MRSSELEQPHPTSANTGDALAPTFAHILFNFSTMKTFNVILSDPSVASVTTASDTTSIEYSVSNIDGASERMDESKSMMALVKMIRDLVNLFHDLSLKNNLLFVEILFRHSRPLDFCVLQDSVYEAKSYYHAYSDPDPLTETHQSNVPSGHDGHDPQTEDHSDKPPNADEPVSKKDNYGDEFDENDEAFAMIQATAGRGRAVSRKVLALTVCQCAFHRSAQSFNSLMPL
jgi:hypothetical protein